jgi:uncharacterized protein YprB with RNaseH-like and TPR domain
MPDMYKKLWDKKAEWIKRKDDDDPESVYERAGIYAEFGKIVCISVGFLKDTEFRLKSFYGDDEKKILNDFAGLLNSHYHQNYHLLCAHNGKEFDFPYLSRRMIINGITLPYVLNIAGKKPWEVNHLDTMELWKFGDYKSYTSLELLALILGLPTPKDDIAGSDIARIYWQEKDLERIARYCQKDVLTVAQILLKLKGETAIPEENITIV